MPRRPTFTHEERLAELNTKLAAENSRLRYIAITLLPQLRPNRLLPGETARMRLDYLVRSVSPDVLRSGVYH
jgi:hypothetical protein